ncbi:hypothetical protein L4174_016715 [Photobacterium sp. CCB-ST2H9]|uniref:hypothetical protein n=1 Tax=Photobacterium sp. CCB-ST2H9 TaxID=2912855 RepID=UPI002003664F|nr:hypothetical protein [Photobacterium sp. CCB-ST2H9]UTM59718.1 hypothetical protein L4174_016715 [Photobacterium sp. CCB-ST2H9]
MTMKSRSRPISVLSHLPLLVALAFPFGAAAESETETPIVAQSQTVGPILADAFEQSGRVWKRNAMAYARLPVRSEIGKAVTTFTLDGEGKPAAASEAEIQENSVIVRDMRPIVGAVYREYLMSREAWFEVYGLMADTLTFHSYQSVQTLRVLTVDEALLAALGSQNGQSVQLNSSVFPGAGADSGSHTQVITLSLGDRVTDSGVIVSPEVLEKDYSPQDIAPEA